MPRRIAALLGVFVLAVPGAARGEPPPAGDALDQALATAGLTRADLGWRARGWWTGYPDVPQKLRHVDDLFAQPLATVPFLRGMGAGARDFLRSGEGRREGRARGGVAPPRGAPPRRGSAVRRHALLLGEPHGGADAASTRR